VKERFEKKDKVMLDEYSDDINYLLVFVSVPLQYGQKLADQSV
jgi:hypothetical protein